MKEYTYVSVIYDDDIVAKTIKEPSFYYLTDLEEIDIDDKVLVNRNGKDVVGIVVDVEYYDEDNVPYPLEKTKNIIKILETSSNSKNIKCPNCGHKMIEIVYGMPSLKTFEKAKKGKIFLGGCIIEDNQPKYHCNNCERSYLEDLKTYIEESNNWIDENEVVEQKSLNYNKITKKAFLKLNERDIMFITNPGRMGDEDGTTFIVKNGNEFIIYRINGWMYPNKDEEEKYKISLSDTTKHFPKWLEAWEHGEEKKYKGKYKYLYMGFGNGLCVDNTIYSEFEPYLNKLVNEYLEDSKEEEKESLKYAAIYNVWEEAFIDMMNDKGYSMKR